MSLHDVTVPTEVTMLKRYKLRTLRQHLMLRLMRHIGRGRLSVEFSDGSRRTQEGPKFGSDASFRLFRDRAITRLIFGGDIGLAEAYVDGDWDSPDLVGLLQFGAENLDTLEYTLSAGKFQKLWNRIQHTLRANTRKGSRRNISFHYDLGNEFYGHWLDETMSYSSALFETPNQGLAEAQQAKYRRLADAVNLEPGSQVIEIGCGWGGFAEIAARDYDSDVVGLTLSVEQRKYAQDRLRVAGLGAKTDIRLQDYRDIIGSFDAVVSIEMFEAVGQENWPTYFDKVRSLLRPGGRAGIQFITINNSRYEAYCNRPDFIQKYIFPGGMLPSPERFEKCVRDAGLEIEDRHFFGTSYAETLRLWNQEFQSRWLKISNLGFDDRFRRLWTYYLAYCEAGFRTGAIDVAQYTLVKP
jgi:cyclopropane-fatty-acyl-phospholipid synthase